MRVGVSIMRFYAFIICLLMLACDQDVVQESVLVERGRQLFNDPKFSISGTQSCATCHPEGNMDNRRWHFPAIHDSTAGVPDSFRTLTLWGVSETGPPYLWDASRNDLLSVTRLYTDTIMGGQATTDEIEALVAYQKSLRFPRNAWLASDGHLTPAQERGRVIYETKGFCTPCHPAPTGTTTKPKDVGTGGVFKTPGLRLMFSMGPYFHDGRARTLADVIAFYEADPSGILRQQGMEITLSAQEEADLIEYMKSF